MELRYGEIGIEVTRRCNQQCRDFCMRGPQQELDISFDYIDLLLDQERNHYRIIDTLFFSGGEPTLFPEAISYSIDQIVSEKLPVFQVAMVTNGLEYSDLVVEAFEKYSKYYDSEILPQKVAKYPKNIQEFARDKLSGQGSYISFSDNQYHKPIPNEVLNLYSRNGPNIIFDHRGEILDTELLKSGFSKQGRELSLEHDNVRIFSDYVIDLVYLTAKGNLSCYGDGSFDFLDEVSRSYSITDYTLDQFCLEKMSSSSKLYDPNEKAKIFKKIK